MRTLRTSGFCLRLLGLALPILLTLPLAAQDNPPGRAGRLSILEGNVSFQAGGQTDWGQATLNYTMTTGDRVYTDQGARAEIEAQPAIVRMSGTTDVTLVNLTDQLTQVGLGQGSIRLTVLDLPSGETVEVDTPNGAITVDRAGSYRFDVDKNSGTRVIVNSGDAQLSGPGLSHTLGNGQAVQLTGTDAIKAATVAVPSPDDFDKWSDSLDHKLTASASASSKYVSTTVPGGADLDSYGQWQQDPQNGPVWYPNSVPPGWVPYSYGNWAWVEPWGWTWVGAEPWGFAPFHYGRWGYFGARWGWVPGPVVVAPVYAPALVAFVGGPGFSLGFGASGFGVAAWFPLGPREPFFPWYHYGGGYLNQVNVTNIRGVTNITNITNINNVNNIHYVNRGVATTAVPSNVFSSGHTVQGHAIKMSQAQLSTGVIDSHPMVNPTSAAERGGKQVAAPPVHSNYMLRGANGNFRTAGGQPAPGHGSQLITKTPPPPSHLAFSTRQQAMQPHPGRPLEPQQRDNLRQGKPPGPMQDKEMPPHAASTPRSAPPGGGGRGGTGH
jgi:hypothetical protein